MVSRAPRIASSMAAKKASPFCNTVASPPRKTGSLRNAATAGTNSSDSGAASSPMLKSGEGQSGRKRAPKTPTTAITPTIIKAQAHQERSAPKPSNSLIGRPREFANQAGPAGGGDQSQTPSRLDPADARR